MITTLFKVINNEHVSRVVLNGYEINEFSDNPNGTMRLACDEGPEWFFWGHQEVRLRPTGVLVAISCEPPGSDPSEHEPKEHWLEFYTETPLKWSHLE